jgi:hypothetical protein
MLQLFPVGRCEHNGEHLSQLPPGVEVPRKSIKPADKPVLLHAQCTAKGCTFALDFTIGPEDKSVPSLYHDCAPKPFFGNITLAHSGHSDVKIFMAARHSPTWPSSLPTASHENLQQWFQANGIDACNVSVTQEYMFGTLQDGDFWSALAPSDVQATFDKCSNFGNISPI